MAVTPEFWRGRRVLLTGHTGFKGSWLSLWLQQLGADVSGYALAPPTQPALYDVAQVGAGMRSVIADIRDGEALAAAMGEAAPEVVVHMAAQALVRHSYQEPVETYATNVMGTVHLLEAVRRTPGVRAVVIVTSDKCYANEERSAGYREGEPLGGHDPYSSSKACTELVAAAYRDSYFNPARYGEHGVALATVRAGNVIGGGDWAVDRLIPDLLRAFEAGRSVAIRNPAAVRPWQHVLEPLAGYLLLAERLCSEGTACAEAWNFGPADEDARPVQWIVERMAAAWGPGAAWHLDDSPQPHEAHYLKLDTAKARARLDWQPRWSLPQALDRIVDWHRDWLASAGMRAACLRQIDDYLQTAVSPAPTFLP